MSETTCYCGHVLDEHLTDESSAPCAVDGCLCAAFEEDPSDEQE